MTIQTSKILLIIFTISILSFTTTIDRHNTSSTIVSTVYANSTNTGGSGIIPPKSNFLPGPSEKDFKNEKGVSETLTNNVLPKIAVYLIGIVGGAAMLFLVIAGVRFSTAYGNDESIQKAKNQALYAVVGIVVALLSYTIVQIVFNINFQN